MHKESRIFVAGHRGLVGSAICRSLERSGFSSLIARTREQLDLRDQAAVRAFFNAERPEYVFLAAARVGGIYANINYPADFIYDNLAVQNSVLKAAFECGVRKLLFLGSSCIYPRHARQPMKEEYLLTGPLEPTNEWYAIAKIAGIKLAQALRRQHGFNAISAMPTNLYGPGDNFDLETSHVVPALIRKFHDAVANGVPEVTVWGTGTPKREFLHVDDLADAAVFLMSNYDDEEIINVGTGVEIAISELAEVIGKVSCFRGRILFDSSKPDGMPRKVLDVSKITALGWRAKRSFEAGIRETYSWYAGRTALETNAADLVTRAN
jgi:GDP-L-fucose synthase